MNDGGWMDRWIQADGTDEGPEATIYKAIEAMTI